MSEDPATEIRDDEWAIDVSHVTKRFRLQGASRSLKTAALDLLRETGLFVHPGFFYDFDEGALVLALVADSEGLRAGFGLLRGWLEKNYL